MQTMGAARERLRERMFVVEEMLDEVGADGKCLLRAIAIVLQDLHVLSVSQHYDVVRHELADFLEAHADDVTGTEFKDQTTLRVDALRNALHRVGSRSLTS